MPQSVFPIILVISDYPDSITLTVLYWVMGSYQSLCSTVKASWVLKLINALWYPQGLENILSPNKCLIKIAEIKEEKVQIKTANFPACALQYSSH